MKTDDQDAIQLGERLDRFIREAGMSYVAFAQQVANLEGPDSKISAQTVTHWRQTGKIARDKIVVICKALGITPNDLFGVSPTSQLGPRNIGDVKNIAPAQPAGVRGVPLISYVAAGRLTEVVDPYEVGDCQSLVFVHEDVSEQGFALRILGDSMEPRFLEGDLIVVDPAVTPHPGDFVVAKNSENEATFKKYRPRGLNDAGVPYFELVPLNPDYPSMRSDFEHLVVIGVMVEHRQYRARRNKP